MILPSISVSDSNIKEMYHGRRNIRNVYRKVNGVVRHLFSADLSYFAISKTNTKKSQFLQWNSIIARSTFSPINVSLTEFVTPSQELYLHLYMPSRYAADIRLYIDGRYVSNPPVIGGESVLIDEGDETERYVPYTFFSIPISGPNVVVEARKFKLFTQTNIVQ